MSLGHGIYNYSLLFTDDMLIVQDTEDDLQRSVYELCKLCKDYNFKLSWNKNRIIAFCGKHPVCSKIVIENNILEQVSPFNYPDCDVSYDYDSDIQGKINKFQQICGTINRTLCTET